jgi:hypothetical protein
MGMFAERCMRRVLELMCAVLDLIEQDDDNNWDADSLLANVDEALMDAAARLRTYCASFAVAAASRGSYAGELRFQWLVHGGI